MTDQSGAPVTRGGADHHLLGAEPHTANEIDDIAEAEEDAKGAPPKNLLDGMIKALPQYAGRLGDDHVVDLTGYGRIAESALTADRKIEMDARGLPTTFVPGRNLIFLVAAAALADRRGLEVLVGGMCETDYSGYPDCRHETMEAMARALSLGLDKPVVIDTPLMWLTKAQTWELADRIGGQALVDLIVEGSHTCYRGDRAHRYAWGYGCGECPACELRATGYEEWAASK